MAACASERERKQIKKVPSKGDFQASHHLHTELFNPAEPEAGRVCSEVGHVFIAGFCIMHLDAVSGGFGGV